MSGGNEQIAACLQKGIPVSHTWCFEQAMSADIRKRHEIDSKHIIWLNEVMIRRNWEPTGDQDTADYLHAHLVKVTEYCANIHEVLQYVKDKVKIQNTEKYRYEEGERRKVEKAKKIESEAEKLDRQQRSAMFAAERENPQLRANRKAAESIKKQFPQMTDEQIDAWLKSLGRKQ